MIILPFYDDERYQEFADDFYSEYEPYDSDEDEYAALGRWFDKYERYDE